MENNKYTVNSLNEVTEEKCQEVLGMSRDEAERKLIRRTVLSLARDKFKSKDGISDGLDEFLDEAGITDLDTRLEFKSNILNADFE